MTGLKDTIADQLSRTNVIEQLKQLEASVIDLKDAQSVGGTAVAGNLGGMATGGTVRARSSK